MSAQTQSILSTGASGLVIDIQCHLSNNLPRIVIVGFANKAVDEAKERLRGAFVSANLLIPRKRVTINLAPADLPKSDSGFDLAIAMAILIGSGQVPPRAGSKQEAFIGELGLDGQTRPVRGIIGKILAGRARQLTDFFIPAANAAQAALIPHVRVYPVSSLRQLVEHCAGGGRITPIDTKDGNLSLSPESQAGLENIVGLSEIVGQAKAKRGLEIAAAGGHNLFFSGPPGTGKSMLAKALPGILPPLEREEVLEVTQLHSLANHDYERIIIKRPFRAPHHSASHVAVIGGGSNLRPGEISLSHRGVLFFDELPEFSRTTLEALRQPLEDRVVSIARARDSVEYPASFILVATANPCPCGYNGVPRSKDGPRCRCQAYQVRQYQSRLSGPILDRIDLFCDVDMVTHDRLLTQAADPASDEAARQRVRAARTIQAARYGRRSKLNADMANSDIKRFALLTPAAVGTLNQAALTMNISARSYMRTVKVARTIADLDGSSPVTRAHLTDALAYHQPPARS